MLVGHAALTHDVHAERHVRQERGDVHRELEVVEHVQVLGERLPVPPDALVQRGAGDVLDAFHHFDQPRLPARAHWREADAAVADDHRRDAVAGRRVDTGSQVA